MQGSPLLNLRMFKELCGEDCFNNIVLGTTFWEVMDSRQPGLAEKREKELVEDFWTDMIEKGSEVVRILESRWLARELLVKLAKKSEMTLKIQRERIDEAKPFELTAASSALNAEKERVRKAHEKEIEARQEKLRKDMEEREAKLKKLGASTNSISQHATRTAKTAAGGDRRTTPPARRGVGSTSERSNKRT